MVPAVSPKSAKGVFVTFANTIFTPCPTILRLSLPSLDAIIPAIDALLISAMTLERVVLNNVIVLPFILNSSLAVTVGFDVVPVTTALPVIVTLVPLIENTSPAFTVGLV